MSKKIKNKILETISKLDDFEIDYLKDVENDPSKMKPEKYTAAFNDKFNLNKRINQWWIKYLNSNI